MTRPPIEPSGQKAAVPGEVRAFGAMAGAYGLGVFNDNFFKQAASLLAVMAARRPELQGYAAALFSLPFVLLAAPAGWCADRFAKARVARWAKVLEVLAMAAGALGLYRLSWPLIMLMLFIMALQSTLFSPAINGAIPETFPEERVVGVNGFMKTVTTAMMLLGMAAAGFVLGLPGQNDAGVPRGRLVAAVAVVAVAVAGCLASRFIPIARPAANPRAPFPWNGPVETVRVLAGCRRDAVLWRVLRQDAFLWGVAMAQTLLINQLAVDTLGLGARGATLLVMAELTGVAAGGALAGWWSRRAGGLARLGPAALIAALGAVAATGIGLAVSLGGAGAVEAVEAVEAAVAVEATGPAGDAVFATRAVFGCMAALFVMGLGGGLMLVPLESALQVRPPAERRGAVLAAGNALSFAAMMSAGGLLALAPGLGVDAVGGFVLISLSFVMLAWVNLRRPFAGEKN